MWRLDCCGVASVTALGTRGSSVYTMQIPLAYVPKQTQTPADTHDYTWSVLHGDSSAFDVSGAGFRFAMYMSRDDVVDGAETGNTFQRYTQQTLTFAAGVQDNFTNTHTSSGAIKDATDPAGAPAGHRCRRPASGVLLGVARRRNAPRRRSDAGRRFCRRRIAQRGRGHADSHP